MPDTVKRWKMRLILTAHPVAERWPARSRQRMGHCWAR